MKYCAYNEKNWSERMGMYFRTKKEAVAYAKQISGQAVVERKCGGDWIPCKW